VSRIKATAIVVLTDSAKVTTGKNGIRAAIEATSQPLARNGNPTTIHIATPRSHHASE
jgi:hypothetical protein